MLSPRPILRTDSRAEFERVKNFRHGPVRPGRLIQHPTTMDRHDRANGGEAPSRWLALQASGLDRPSIARKLKRSVHAIASRKSHLNQGRLVELGLKAKGK